MENSTSSENSGSGATTNGSLEEPAPQLFCLRWNNYQSNLTNVFDQLLQNESFVDVTLSCSDGHSVKAHKMVLSACSPYFQSLFCDNPCKHPIVILKDIKWTELKAAVEFMYKGEINVCQEQIGPLLKVAESLKIRGLADVSNEQDLTSERRSPTSTTTSTTPSVTTNSEINRSPNRSLQQQVLNAPVPSKKRRRTSTDRGSSTNTEDTINVVNSPPRTLELITSPSSSVVNAIPLTTNPSATIGQNSVSQTNASQNGNRPSQSSTPQSPPNMGSLSVPPPPPSATLPSTSSVDDMEIRPGIAEMIREEERAKMLESSQAWLNASTSSLTYYPPTSSSSLSLSSSSAAAAASVLTLAQGRTVGSPGPVSLKLKVPTWTQSQLKEAIQAVVTQRMRFTQASVHYGIPKGTLYDNILGKTNRMQALEEAALTPDEENAVLQFCCQILISPYNRRTRKSLSEVLNFVQSLKQARDPSFVFNEMSGFRWWWAFCKKHSIVSLHFSGASSKCSTSTSFPSSSYQIDQNNPLWNTENSEPFDFSTNSKDRLQPQLQAAPVGFSTLQEYFKLSVESSLASITNSNNHSDQFVTMEEIMQTSSPVCL